MDKNRFGRRNFLEKTLGLSASLYLLSGLDNLAFPNERNTKVQKAKYTLDNLLIMYDDFHTGMKRNYSIKARMNAARTAGYHGFELITINPNSQNFKDDLEAASAFGFKSLGVYFLAFGVTDYDFPKMKNTLQQIDTLVALGKEAGLSYINLTFQGHGELRGETIGKSGSALAGQRHWDRAKKILEYFAHACSDYGIKAQLYPHSYYVVDTPQLASKIVRETKAPNVQPILPIQHWYANQNTLALKDIFQLPEYKGLDYVMMTDAIIREDGSMKAVKFGTGEIDYAQILALLLNQNYAGSLATHGWKIGGDPYESAESFVKTLHGLVERFNNYPELWPLNQ